MMRIFWCFSNFLQLHPILANYRIGAITLKIVEFEIKRHELRLEEERLMEAAASSDEAVAKLEREKKRNKKRMKKQDQLLYVMREQSLDLPSSLNLCGFVSKSIGMCALACCSTWLRTSTRSARW